MTSPKLAMRGAIQWNCNVEGYSGCAAGDCTLGASTASTPAEASMAESPSMVWIVKVLGGTWADLRKAEPA